MTDKIIDYEKLKSGGFMRQLQQDQFALRLRIVGGRVEADQLRVLADAAEKYGDGHIHLTSRQGVEIPFVNFDDIDDIGHDLEGVDLRRGTCGPRVRGVVACQGNTLCPRGLVDPQNLAKKIDEKYFAADAPHKFKIAVTGCPASCLKPQENDFGIMGVVEPKWIEDKCINCGLCEQVCRMDAIKVDDETVHFDREKCDLCGDCIASCPTDAWENARTGYTIYIGGKIGRKPKLGTKFVELVDEKTLFDILEKTLNFYRENANTGERFGETIDRLGIEIYKEAVLK